MTPTSLTEARRAVGLGTPQPAAKKLIWSKCSVPTAGITRGYKPVHGSKLAHYSDTRYVGVSGGWRSGKSLYAGLEGVTWLPYAKLVWIVGRDYDMTRQEFIYLSEAAVSCGLAIDRDVHLSLNKYSPSVMKSITGCIVETRTLADFRKLASKAPDLVIVCEPGLIPNLRAVMELIAGRVAEKRGCVIAAGTSDESSEEWFDLWSRWQLDNPEGGQSFSIPSWQNTYAFPRGREEEEFRVYEQVYGYEALMAHYGGIPSAPRNLVLRGYFAETLHVVEGLSWKEGLPTEIAIDPNYSAPNAYSIECIQWSLETGELFLVDEIAESGLHHDAMKELAYAKPWWSHVTGGTIDPHAEGSIYGNHPPYTYWLPLPLRMDHRPRVATTVQALKEALAPQSGKPRMVVSDKCVRFRKEARLWKTDQYGVPAKTWCDAMKATGYWLVDRFGEERMPGWDTDESNEVVVSDWQLV